MMQHHYLRTLCKLEKGTPTLAYAAPLFLPTNIPLNASMVLWTRPLPNNLVHGLCGDAQGIAVVAPLILKVLPGRII
jgi:hypothetical protein